MVNLTSFINVQSRFPRASAQLWLWWRAAAEECERTAGKVGCGVLAALARVCVGLRGVQAALCGQRRSPPAA